MLQVLRVLRVLRVLQVRVASALAVTAVLSGGASAAPQPAPAFINATVEARSVSGSLEREMQSAGAARRVVWVAYRVATIPVRNEWCSNNARPTRVMLEPSRSMTVLTRLESGAITELRTVADHCEVDAGGVPVLRLDGVTADASVTWLRTLVARDGATNGATNGARRMGERAMNALAWTDSRSAIDALIELARRDTNRDRRGKALFWLSQRAGEEAVATISSAINADPDTDVKKKAVFALSQLPQEQGVPLLIQVARTHANREVRKQAMFWLGQSKDPRALSFFEEVLRR